MSSRNLDEILKDIENLRSKLNELAKDKYLADEEVISLSRKLDAVLNEYELAIRKKKNNN